MFVQHLRWNIQNALIAAIAVIICSFVVLFSFSGCDSSSDSVKLSVEEYSWGELSKISNEISQSVDEGSATEVAKKYNLVNSDGKLDGTQTKRVQLSNGDIATVQIAGFSHDDKTGGGKAGITFIFKNAITEHGMNSRDTNLGGWEGSSMRSWLASDGMSMLPQDLASVIVPVDKKTNNIGETTTVSSVTVTSDKLWLFSYVELDGETQMFQWLESIGYANYRGHSVDYENVLNAEGKQYKLFIDCGVSSSEGANDIFYKSYDGSQSYWWQRTPTPTDSGYFYFVSGFCSSQNSDFASHYFGVAPGFCI